MLVRELRMLWPDLDLGELLALADRTAPAPARKPALKPVRKPALKPAASPAQKSARKLALKPAARRPRAPKIQPEQKARNLTKRRCIVLPSDFARQPGPARRSRAGLRCARAGALIDDKTSVIRAS